MKNLKCKMRNLIKTNFILRGINILRLKIATLLKNKKYSKMNRKETFEYIYKNQVWGKNTSSKFFSGEGSHEKKYIEPYCKMLEKFIKDNNIKTLCDLGCGDFHIGSRISEYVEEYIGVDIVEDIIENHNKLYGCSKVRFECIDIVQEKLPMADLCLIRQVLQHCSNDEIFKILNQTKQFKYVIITEHITKKNKATVYNLEKNHGSHTRTSAKSGVYLEEEPFNIENKELLKISYTHNAKLDEELVTTLISNSTMPANISK